MGCWGEDPHHRASGDSLGCPCAPTGWGGQHGHHPCWHGQRPHGPVLCPCPCVCAGGVVVALGILQLVLGCGNTSAARGPVVGLNKPLVCCWPWRVGCRSCGQHWAQHPQIPVPSSLNSGTRCLAQCVPLAPAVPQAGHDSRLPGDVRNVTVTHRGELWGYRERVSLSSPVRGSPHPPCTMLAGMGGPGGAGGAGGQRGAAGPLASRARPPRAGSAASEETAGCNRSGSAGASCPAPRLPSCAPVA